MRLNIRELREHKRVNQEELAQITGISKRMLSDYENNTRDIPLSKLLNIAHALKVSVSDLIEETNNGTKESNVIVKESVSVANEEQGKYAKNTDVLIMQLEHKDEKIKLLEREVRDKEEIIRLLKSKGNLSETANHA